DLVEDGLAVGAGGRIAVGGVDRLDRAAGVTPRERDVLGRTRAGAGEGVVAGGRVGVRDATEGIDRHRADLGRRILLRRRILLAGRLLLATVLIDRRHGGDVADDHLP